MALVTSATSKASSGFSPTTLPGCVLWLDAADSNTMTLSGSNITEWKDKSLSANHFTAIAGSPPVLSNYNSLNAISWTSTNQQLYSASNNVTTGNATRTMFVAMHAPSSGGSQFFLVTGNESGGNPATAYGFGKNAGADYVYPFLYSSTGADVYSNIAGGITSNPTVLTSTFDGSNIIGWINGKYRVARTTALNTTPGIWYLGRRQQTGTGSTSSLLLEVIQYSVELNAEQRQLVEGYLSKKWGFASDLSAGYTYKTDTFFMRPFSPLDISDCGLWLDAVDVASFGFASTSNINVWKDKSGRGWDFSQATSGRYPVHTSNAIGSNQMVSFSGAASQGASTQVLDNMSFQLSNSNYSIFMVTKKGASSDSYTGYNYALKATPNNDGVLFFGNVPSKDFAVFTGAGLDQWNEVSANSPATTVLNTTRILGMVNSNTTYTPYYDGYTMTSKSGGTYAFTGLRIGDAGDPGPRSGQNWNGQIGEIVIYNQSLSATARRQLEGYLAWKWGKVTDLSTSHPFKLVPPLVPVFTPLQIPGCALWLDADDNRTITKSGSTISTWSDKSGNGYVFNTAPSGCSLPVVGTAINGRSTVGITSASMGIKQTSVIDGLKTIFWIRREITGNRAYEFYFGADSTQDFHTGTSEYAGSGLAQNGVRDASLNIITSSNIVTGTPGGTAASGGYAINILRMSGLTGSTRVQGLSYDRGNTGRSMQCDWGEVLFYTTALSSFQIATIEGYLAQKWGVRSYLPTTHPYKVITP